MHCMGSVASIRRYPVKSMMGEELTAIDITKKGLLGDRAYGVIDMSTGKLANAKNPIKWPEMFSFHANYLKAPELDAPIPPIRITLPGGATVSSTDEKIHTTLTESLKREVKLASPSGLDVQFEGYIPENVEGLEDPGTIFTRTSPPGTFFDIAMVHIITTSTINYLRKILPDSDIEAARFRPNMILDVPDEDGFIENSWIDKVLQIGENVQLKILQPTKRCVMTTLAQGDLPKDPNVLKSIVKNNNGNFGVYAEVIQAGKIHHGDKVKIREFVS